jgi:hypothetical protein
VGKQLELPGVRSGNELMPWPFSHSSSRPTPTSGGDYVATRRALLTRYAARWLLAVHNLDIVSYAKLLYELCTDISGDIPTEDTAFLVPQPDQMVEVSLALRNVCRIIEAPQRRAVKSFDQALRLIVKLVQASVVFTAFDDIYSWWLESVPSEAHLQVCPFSCSSPTIRTSLVAYALRTPTIQSRG